MISRYNCFSFILVFIYLTAVVDGYGYKFSRLPQSKDCRLQLNLPGYPPSFHSTLEDSSTRYSNKFTGSGSSAGGSYNSKNHYQSSSTNKYHSGQSPASSGSYGGASSFESGKRATTQSSTFGNYGGSSSSAGHYGNGGHQQGYQNFNTKDMVACRGNEYYSLRQRRCLLKGTGFENTQGDYNDKSVLAASYPIVDTLQSNGIFSVGSSHNSASGGGGGVASIGVVTGGTFGGDSVESQSYGGDVESNFNPNTNSKNGGGNYNYESSYNNNGGNNGENINYESSYNSNSNNNAGNSNNDGNYGGSYNEESGSYGISSNNGDNFNNYNANNNEKIEEVNYEEGSYNNGGNGDQYQNSYSTSDNGEGGNYNGDDNLNNYNSNNNKETFNSNSNYGESYNNNGAVSSNNEYDNGGSYDRRQQNNNHNSNNGGGNSYGNSGSTASSFESNSYGGSNSNSYDGSSGGTNSNSYGGSNGGNSNSYGGSSGSNSNSYGGSSGSNSNSYGGSSGSNSNSYGGSSGSNSNSYGGSEASSLGGSSLANTDETITVGLSITDKKFAQEALDAHNAYRAKHGSYPLVLDDKLTEISQTLADSLASGGKLHHSPEAKDGKVGENIAIRSGATTGSAAVKLWYDEIGNYDYQNPILVRLPPNKSNVEFTSVVWNSTRKLGIGKSVSKDGRTYIVANYYPPGNIPGKLEDNVFTPIQRTSSSSRVSSRGSY